MTDEQGVAGVARPPVEALESLRTKLEELYTGLTVGEQQFFVTLLARAASAQHGDVGGFDDGAWTITPPPSIMSLFDTVFADFVHLT